MIKSKDYEKCCAQCRMKKKEMKNLYENNGKKIFDIE